jgi:RNA recognition motif-containing protein
MSTEDERKLFVAGLPDSMTEDVLRQLFEATGGTVVNVTLPKHRDTGRPRGFGFVTFAAPEQAAQARAELDGSIQGGRSISVRPFQSEPPRRDARSESPGPMSGGNTGDRTLYVGNLPYDATQPDLEALFTEHGVAPVVRIHLPVGPDGRMRGFGFVTMGSAEAANAAIVALRGVEMKGRGLMVNIAHPRGERPSGGGAGGYGGPPSRRDNGPPSMGGGYTDFDPSSAPLPPPDAHARGGDRGGGGGDRRDGPDWDAKKKKKKRGRIDAGAKKGRDNRKPWKDWDDD